MKRLLDIAGSLIGLCLGLPILVPVIFLIWKQDNCSPFYIAPRVGSKGRLFNMIKLRSMVINADKSGVDSTAANDSRITPIGIFIRKYKLDELTQLWNVLKGDMSLVGPRPNVKKETDLYTQLERKLLSVKPGITDFSSIVFSDESEILRDKLDPDLAYHQLIRPGKSLLGLFYINKKSLLLDIVLILITVIALISKSKALDLLRHLLRRIGASRQIIEVASRKKPLVPTPPPGAEGIVTSR